MECPFVHVLYIGFCHIMLANVYIRFCQVMYVGTQDMELDIRNDLPSIFWYGADNKVEDRGRAMSGHASSILVLISAPRSTLRHSDQPTYQSETF